MTADRPGVELLFLWHHHQPDYRSPRTGVALLPWVRLHAVKDYLDMALHLERHAGVRATFNFVPALVDQLEDAVAGKGDALFDLLRRPVADLAPEEREAIAFRCTQCPPRTRERWPEYAALRRRAVRAHEDRGAPLDDRELASLEAWFLYSWLDPTSWGEPEAMGLLAARQAPGGKERDALLDLIARLLARVLPAYRALAARGQIELSTSPYAHPILPLLVDTAIARRARPDLHLPSPGFAAPEDAARQIERAIARHTEVFGTPPRGLWPSEGSVSPEVAGLVAAAGLRWMATDEGNLWRSLPAEARKRGLLHQPWTVERPEGRVSVFFRDHELSDRIGFVYHHWEAGDAVADFIARLEKIADEHGAGERPVVTVALDGENCWEHYADDGGPFLEALYTALEGNARIRTVTPSEVLERRGPGPKIETLHSGSWIDSDFHIWIGHPEKNRAWERIAEARRDLVASGATEAGAPEAWESLHAAEGSDWFWWLGVDHHTLDKDVFDRILREHLAGTYERRAAAPPPWVHEPIAGVVRLEDESAPLGYVHPALDGRETSYYEWRGAGRLSAGAGGSMHRDAGLLREVFYGVDAAHLYLRVDLEPAALADPAAYIEVEIVAGGSRRGLEWPVVAGSHGIRTGDAPLDGARAVVGEIVEAGIPLGALGLKAGDEIQLTVRTRSGGERTGEIASGAGQPIRISGPEDEAAQWSA